MFFSDVKEAISQAEFFALNNKISYAIHGVVNGFLVKVLRARTGEELEVIHP